MSLDFKRQLVAQLVESSRLLRNYIDQRAKMRGTTRAQWIVMYRLRQQEGLSQVDLTEMLELQPISLRSPTIAPNFLNPVGISPSGVLTTISA